MRGKYRGGNPRDQSGKKGKINSDKLINYKELGRRGSSAERSAHGGDASFNFKIPDVYDSKKYKHSSNTLSKIYALSRECDSSPKTSSVYQLHQNVLDYVLKTAIDTEVVDRSGPLQNPITYISLTLPRLRAEMCQIEDQIERTVLFENSQKVWIKYVNIFLLPYMRYLIAHITLCENVDEGNGGREIVDMYMYKVKDFISSLCLDCLQPKGEVCLASPFIKVLCETLVSTLPGTNRSNRGNLAQIDLLKLVVIPKLIRHPGVACHITYTALTILISASMSDIYLPNTTISEYLDTICNLLGVLGKRLIGLTGFVLALLLTSFHMHELATDERLVHMVCRMAKAVVNLSAEGKMRRGVRALILTSLKSLHMRVLPTNRDTHVITQRYINELLDGNTTSIAASSEYTEENLDEDDCSFLRTGYLYCMDALLRHYLDTLDEGEDKIAIDTNYLGHCYIRHLWVLLCVSRSALFREESITFFKLACKSVCYCTICSSRSLSSTISMLIMSLESRIRSFISNMNTINSLLTDTILSSPQLFSEIGSNYSNSFLNLLYTMLRELPSSKDISARKLYLTILKCLSIICVRKTEGNPDKILEAMQKSRDRLAKLETQHSKAPLDSFNRDIISVILGFFEKYPNAVSDASKLRSLVDNITYILLHVELNEEGAEMCLNTLINLASATNPSEIWKVSICKYFESIHMNISSRILSTLLRFYESFLEWEHRNSTLNRMTINPNGDSMVVLKKFMQLSYLSGEKYKSFLHRLIGVSRSPRVVDFIPEHLKHNTISGEDIESMLVHKNILKLLVSSEEPNAHVYRGCVGLHSIFKKCAYYKAYNGGPSISELISSISYYFRLKQYSTVGGEPLGALRSNPHSPRSSSERVYCNDEEMISCILAITTNVSRFISINEKLYSPTHRKAAKLNTISAPKDSMHVLHFLESRNYLMVLESFSVHKDLWDAAILTETLGCLVECTDTGNSYGLRRVLSVANETCKRFLKKNHELITQNREILNNGGKIKDLLYLASGQLLPCVSLFSSHVGTLEPGCIHEFLASFAEHLSRVLSIPDIDKPEYCSLRLELAAVASLTLGNIHCPVGLVAKMHTILDNLSKELIEVLNTTDEPGYNALHCLNILGLTLGFSLKKLIGSVQDTALLGKIIDTIFTIARASHDFEAKLSQSDVDLYSNGAVIGMLIAISDVNPQSAHIQDRLVNAVIDVILLKVPMVGGRFVLNNGSISALGFSKTTPTLVLLSLLIYKEWIQGSSISDPKMVFKLQNHLLNTSCSNSASMEINFALAYFQHVCSQSRKGPAWFDMKFSAPERFNWMAEVMVMSVDSDYVSIGLENLKLEHLVNASKLVRLGMGSYNQQCAWLHYKFARAIQLHMNKTILSAIESCSKTLGSDSSVSSKVRIAKYVEDFSSIAPTICTVFENILASLNEYDKNPEAAARQIFVLLLSLKGLRNSNSLEIVGSIINLLESEIKIHPDAQSFSLVMRCALDLSFYLVHNGGYENLKVASLCMNKFSALCNNNAIFSSTDCSKFCDYVDPTCSELDILYNRDAMRENNFSFILRFMFSNYGMELILMKMKSKLNSLHIASRKGASCIRPESRPNISKSKCMASDTWVNMAISLLLEMHNLVMASGDVKMLASEARLFSASSSVESLLKMSESFDKVILKIISQIWDVLETKIVKDEIPIATGINIVQDIVSIAISGEVSFLEIAERIIRIKGGKTSTVYPICVAWGILKKLNIDKSDIKQDFRERVEDIVGKYADLSRFNPGDGLLYYAINQAIRASSFQLWEFIHGLDLGKYGSIWVYKLISMIPHMLREMKGADMSRDLWFNLLPLVITNSRVYLDDKISNTLLQYYSEKQQLYYNMIVDAPHCLGNIFDEAMDVTTMDIVSRAIHINEKGLTKFLSREELEDMKSFFLRLCTSLKNNYPFINRFHISTIS